MKFPLSAYYYNNVVHHLLRCYVTAESVQLFIFTGGLIELISSILKGILMGIANVMPGVSGGTLAISLGIYDRMMEAISHLFRDFKKSVRFLFPLMLGMAVGIICFTYLLEYLFLYHPFPACMAFMGLILGGLPALYSAYIHSTDADENRFSWKHLVLFLSLAALTVIFSLLRTPAQSETVLSGDGIHRIHLFLLFFLGILSAGTMIIPGVSGSLLLMILGYYYEILHAVKLVLEDLRTLNMDLLFQSALSLLPFGIGLVLGIFLFARLVEYLFHHHAAATYSAVLGLIAASPAAILLNTSFTAGVTLPEILTGITGLFLGVWITRAFGE